MEHWSKSDVSLCGEFTRSYFAVMVDGKPLVEKAESTFQHLNILPYQELSEKLAEYGLKVDPDCCALLDAIKKDSCDLVPLMGLSLKSVEMPDDSPISIDFLRNKLGSALGGSFVNLRIALLTLPLERDRNLVAKMQSLLKWSYVWRHCPRCARPLRMSISKAAAFCISCKETYYPPLSPVASCLITNSEGTEALLIRHRGGRKDLYTVVSGFAQVGETFEETVRREVAEEVGIECRRISPLKASTSWPIPYGSLMCGFFAVADPEQTMVINVDEIEAANWFSRAEIAVAFEQAKLNTLEANGMTSVPKDNSSLFYIPPKGSIAFQLIKRWLGS